VNKGIRNRSVGLEKDRAGRQATTLLFSLFLSPAPKKHSYTTFLLFTYVHSMRQQQQRKILSLRAVGWYRRVERDGGVLSSVGC
jgi:hypothetical protein